VAGTAGEKTGTEVLVAKPVGRTEIGRRSSGYGDIMKTDLKKKQDWMV